jgi:putative transposase
MTAPSSIDLSRFLYEHLASASPDLLRSMLRTFINTLMSAEADAVCGAAYGESSPERVNTRNDYRPREFDTRAGTLDVAIPKLCSGSYFPDWLLELRRRAERALTTVVATCYLLGVSTRRMEKLVESLGITRLSKSQVSTRAGRVLRPHPGKTTAEIHDYHDTLTGVVASSLAKRAPGYRSIGFPDPRRARR